MKKRILVVDDDFLIRELLKFKLSRLGFEVITARNEKEFWEQTFVKKPDLIILDVRLKNRSGPSAYQNLVDFVGFDPDVPVIFISAFLENETFPPHPAGDRAIFIKPFNFEELLGEINRMLGRTRKHKNAAAAALIFFILISGAVPLIFPETARAAPQAQAAFQKPHKIATWYSRKDPRVGRHTASGEVFDDSKHTCAIWGMPFGTRLKVTNLENRKSIVCRVNDRGPARRLKRHIDLSRASFRKIASLRQGLIRVSIVKV